MFRRFLVGTALVLVGVVALQALADTVKLKDGTTLEGTVIKFGDSYRVKLADGTTKTVSASDVASISKGATPAASVSPNVNSPGASQSPAVSKAAAPAPTPANAGSSGNFTATKQRADSVDAPVLAVTIWEKFIESNPASTDAANAKTELEKWQKLQKDNAERINGKWVGGEERKKILKEVDRLCTEARGQMDDQTLQAIEKYEKAIKLYPNCFEANFAMGYYHLTKGVVGSTGRGNLAELDKAIKSLETAVRLRPNSASALSNLAIGYNFRDRFEEAVLTAYKATKIEDNKEVVENLVNCLVRAPTGMKTNNKKVKPIIEEAFVLSRKYGISVQGSGSFHYIRPEAPGSEKTSDDKEGEEEGRAGIIGNGSGFLVSADGYILTNRHVVNEKNRLFRVRFDDGTEKNADVVAIDTQYDIALIKIKSESRLPYLKIAEAPRPNPGAQCMVLGYPVANLLDFKMQVTSGEITSSDEGSDYEVTLTANTTHGNSGGPIVDRDGNVVGVLSAGMSAYSATYIKALSAGQIHSFLERCKDKYTATFEPGKAANTAFDGENLAKEARKATLLVLIIRGDGKESITDIANAKVGAGESSDDGQQKGN